MPTPLRHTPVSIALVAVPEVSAAVLYGLHEVFTSVSTSWQIITGEPVHAVPMTPRVVAATTDPVQTALGIPVTADASFTGPERWDVIIVADLTLEPGISFSGRWPDASYWLREQYNSGAIVCSVCTGALMLAEAGLLDDQEATTHWSATGLFSAHYPSVKLKPERVLSPTGPGHRIVTSGGSASWTDLALYLVARFSGQPEARRIAKIFVIGDRGDGQLPFAAMARPRQHEDAVIARCQSWIADNYSLNNPVQRMADHSGLGSRTFKRRFAHATGYAPLDYVQTLRVEEAKQILESDDLPIDAVAASVGYDDPRSFRRLFKRLTGINPAQYRQRFQTIGVVSG